MAETENTKQRLVRGNARFMSGIPESLPMRERLDLRREVAKGQHPFAIVLTCSDSRVPPELIFDCNLGDLFVVRTAGHTLDNMVVGSIEYAVEHLHCHTILVMGHQDCGAVTAAVNDSDEPSCIDDIVTSIQEAIGAITKIETAVKAYTKHVATKLAESPVFVDKDIEMLSGYYALDTGRVQFI